MKRVKRRTRPSTKVNVVKLKPANAMDLWTQHLTEKEKQVRALQKQFRRSCFDFVRAEEELREMKSRPEPPAKGRAYGHR